MPRDRIEAAIRSFQEGRRRESSFRLLFETYRRPLDRFFARKGFAPEERGDLTQDTFLGIYRGLDGFRHDARFESWLYRIATTTCLKRLRTAGAGKRRGREIELNEAGAVAADVEAVRPDDPLRAMLRDERREALRAVIERLPPQMRRCLTLRVYQERSYREIATLMKIEIDTVKAHLFQARERLRREVDLAPFEPPAARTEPREGRSGD